MKKPDKQTIIVLSLTASIMACAGNAQDDEKELIDQIKKLEDRVGELEGKGPMGEGAMKAGGWEAWLGAVKFSGFASASYLYNFNRPSDLTPNSRGDTDYTRGRSFDGAHNEFTL